jgi:AraC-like DNA-binding protein
MKVIPFNIPRGPNESFRVQADEGPHLYNHLHQHPEIQITLIREGTGILVAGNYIGRFQPGDVFVIGSGQPHVFRNDKEFFSKQLHASALSVYFDQFTLGQSFWQIEETKTFRDFFAQSLGGYKITGRAMTEIQEAMEGIAQSRFFDKIIGFLQIIKALHRQEDLQQLTSHAHVRKAGVNNRARMKEVMDFTLREHHRNISLKEVANIAHLTPEAFCKYFKTHTQKTYINFLNEVRVNNACRCLLEGSESVSSVCYKTGFSNLANFNRVFKKFTGLTPREYRKL